jgi:LCP family protein required for cell wall assembly
MGEGLDETVSSPRPVEPGAGPTAKRRRRPRIVQLIVLVVNLLLATACFAGAAALVLGQQVVSNTKKSAAIVQPTTTVGTSTSPSPSPAGGPTATSAPTTTPLPGQTTPSGAEATDGAATTAAPVSDAPTTTEPFPNADPQAKNFLITGSDNGACPDPDSANPVDNRDTLGERSDTIMVMRVDPSTSRAAVLSFPRDLWVKIAGTNGRNRINAAYVVNDPTKLVETIRLNFGINIDHSIQVDFCAFKKLVDAVGGVSVYFQYAAKDPHTGLDIPVNDACYTLNGDQALAYVRSRHYRYLDPKTNKFKEDPASDFGRISRQQDFLRRAVAKILASGFDIGVARALIDVAQNNVVVDANLTLDLELQFAGVLKKIDPQAIQTYQVEGANTVKSGAAVIEPRLNGANMKAILAVFRGQAQLATAPEQVFDATTTTAPNTTTTVAPATTDSAAGPATSVEPGAATATPSTTSTTTTTTTTTVPATTTTVSNLPESNAEEINKGIYPPKDKICP